MSDSEIVTVEQAVENRLLYFDECGGALGNLTLNEEARLLRLVLDLRAELLRVEGVLVAADRLREAYDAMLDGVDLGELPDWTRRTLSSHTEKDER